MYVTTMIKGTMNWEQLSNAIRLGILQPGDKINIEGCDWKVLAKVNSSDGEGSVLIWKCTGVEDHVFNMNCSNTYEGSDIQKYLQTDFREDLPEEMLQMVTDEGFFLLTVDQIMEYMPREADRIATHEDGHTVWWWTSSPYVGGGYSVRSIYPSGNVYFGNAYDSIGVAPACWLQSLHL